MTIKFTPAKKTQRITPITGKASGKSRGSVERKDSDHKIFGTSGLAYHSLGFSANSSLNLQKPTSLEKPGPSYLRQNILDTNDPFGPVKHIEKSLGFYVEAKDGKVVVADVCKSTPASRAGLHIGMEVLRIGDINVGNQPTDSPDLQTTVQKCNDYIRDYLSSDLDSVSLNLRLTRQPLKDESMRNITPKQSKSLLPSRKATRSEIYRRNLSDIPSVFYSETQPESDEESSLFREDVEIHAVDIEAFIRNGNSSHWIIDEYLSLLTLLNPRHISHLPLWVLEKYRSSRNFGSIASVSMALLKDIVFVPVQIMITSGTFLYALVVVFFQMNTVTYYPYYDTQYDDHPNDIIREMLADLVGVDELDDCWKFEIKLAPLFHLPRKSALKSLVKSAIYILDTANQIARNTGKSNATEGQLHRRIASELISGRIANASVTEEEHWQICKSFLHYRVGDTLRQLSTESRKFVIQTKFEESRRQNLYRYTLHTKEEATRNITLNSPIYRNDIWLLRQHLPRNEQVRKGKQTPTAMLRNILCISANGDPFNPMSVLQAFIDNEGIFSEKVFLPNTDSFILSNHENNLYILSVGRSEMYNPLLIVFYLLRLVENTGTVEEVSDIHAVKFLCNFARNTYTTNYWQGRRNVEIKIFLADTKYLTYYGYIRYVCRLIQIVSLSKNMSIVLMIRRDADLNDFEECLHPDIFTHIVSSSGLLNISKSKFSRSAQGTIAQQRLSVAERQGSLLPSRNINYKHKPLYERYTIRRGSNKRRKFLSQKFQASQTDVEPGETQITRQPSTSILSTPHPSALTTPVLRLSKVSRRYFDWNNPAVKHLLLFYFKTDQLKIQQLQKLIESIVGHDATPPITSLINRIKTFVLDPAIVTASLDDVLRDLINHAPGITQYQHNAHNELNLIETKRLANVKRDGNSLFRFETQENCLQFYGTRFLYSSIIARVTRFLETRLFIQFMAKFCLQRQCATVEYMKMNPHLKWVLFLDGDIGVINPRHEIEEFIHERTDAEIELIFFERLITWEIMAGAYLAKNTPFVHDFLSEWANYVSNKVFHQDDQGPLHQILMRRFLPSKEKFSLCEQFYNSSRDFGSYLDYVACARYFLGINTRSFGSHIKLIRRGDAWVRDGQDLATSLWSDRDFMFHCWKESHQSWIRPFTKKDAFQLENCRLNPNRTREAVFAENWQYDPKLKKTDHEIEAIIDKIRNMSIKNYEWALRKIRISR